MAGSAPQKKRLKKKLGKQQTKTLLPIIKKFNQMAGLLIRSLTQKIEHEERQLSKIRVMVNDIKVPASAFQSNINITTVDIGKTTVKEKGSFAHNQVMDWEKDLGKRSKGIIL